MEVIKTLPVAAATMSRVTPFYKKIVKNDNKFFF